MRPRRPRLPRDRFPLAPFLLLAAALAAAPPRAEAAAAGLLPSEVSLFAAGVAPASAETVVAPGEKLSLRPGPGAGVGVLFREPNRLATAVTLELARLPLRLAGPGGAVSGGSLDLVPVGVVEQLRFAHGRLEPYLGAGLTFPFTPRTELSGALRRSGVGAVRRPDHPAFLVNAGIDVALSDRAALVLDLRWVPYAETLVVTPAGASFKSQELMLDFNPLTLSVGVALHPGRP